MIKLIRSDKLIIKRKIVKKLFGGIKKIKLKRPKIKKTIATNIFIYYNLKIWWLNYQMISKK